MVGSCGTSSSRQPFVRSVVRAGEFLSRNVVDIVVRWLMTVVHSFGEDKKVSTWARFIRPEPEPCLRHLLRSEARLCSLSSRPLVWPVFFNVSFAVSFAVSRLKMASRLFQKTTLAHDRESKT